MYMEVFLDLWCMFCMGQRELHHLLIFFLEWKGENMLLLYCLE